MRIRRIGKGLRETTTREEEKSVMKKTSISTQSTTTPGPLQFVIQGFPDDL